MALPTNNINTLEKSKFVDVDGSVAIRVAPSQGMAPASYNEIQITYPTATTEVFTYKLATISVGVVTVTYTDSTKETISSVVRT